MVLSSETILKGITSFYKTSPYIAAFFTGGIKASLADLVAQKKEGLEQREVKLPTLDSSEKLDKDLETAAVEVKNGNVGKYKRNFSFFLFGSIYQGIAVQFIFTRVLEELFGSEKRFKVIIGKILFEQFIISPLLTLPLVYLCKALVYKFSIDQAIKRYVYDVQVNGLLKKFWKFWIPAHFITFGFIPIHFRVVFIASLSFFWMIILSSIISREKASKNAEG